jgi:hypothetical protein
VENADLLENPEHLSRGKGFLLFLAMCIFFLVCNRGAYRGYFHDDDLDTLSWERMVRTVDFVRPILSPLFQINNFRPAAAVNYNAVEKLFGLEFPPYIVLIHGLHLFNVWLVWLLARQLGADTFAASVATLFFGFHAASFDIYWKALFMFDLECGTFCLLSLLFYIKRRYVLSFVAFWLAYKCKEIGVMLPAVFVVYEFWRGDRRWLRLIPFFLVSASFGLQGVFLNHHVDDLYTLRFTPAALITTSRFYSSYFLLIHHAAFAAVPLALIFGNARVRFGIVMMLLFMVPFAFLPGRLEPAYCYVPLIGLAVSVSGIASRRYALPTIAILIAWVGYNLYRLQLRQDVELKAVVQNRTYVETLAKFIPTAPAIEFYIFDGAPPAMRPWGVHGALTYLRKVDTTVFSADALQPGDIPPGSPVGILKWDPSEQKLQISTKTMQ